MISGGVIVEAAKALMAQLAKSLVENFGSLKFICEDGRSSWLWLWMLVVAPVSGSSQEIFWSVCYRGGFV
jgi:hypothetical protein